jgi:hypothetical protein
MAAASCCYTRLNTFVAMNISAAQTILQPSRLALLGVVALATSPVSSIVGRTPALDEEAARPGALEYHEAANEGGLRRNAIINRGLYRFTSLFGRCPGAYSDAPG